MKEYYEVFGRKIKKIDEYNSATIYVASIISSADIERQWVIDYKNNLHPNDDWTNVNVETYGRWLSSIDSNESHKLIGDALEAHVVSFIE